MNPAARKPLDYSPFTAERWGFKLHELAEVQEGRAWVRCTVRSFTDCGAIVRTVEPPGKPARLLYVSDAQCLRKPEPRDAREAFRQRERERVAAIEARQAAQCAAARGAIPA